MKFVFGFLIIMMILSACFNPWQDSTGNIIINLGSDNSRSSLWPPQEYEILNQLRYEILIYYEDDEIELDANGGDFIKQTVAVGLWNIKIDAFYKGKHFAAGSNSVNIKPGQDNLVTIEMEELDTFCYECEHDEILPTCDKDGKEITTCVIELHNEEISIKKLDHFWGEWQESIPSTCIIAGSKKRECELCKEPEMEDIALLDHEEGKWEIIEESCCSKEGLKKLLCTNCDYAFEVETIPLLNHEWELTPIAPGYSSEKCLICEETGGMILTLSFLGTGPAGGVIIYVDPDGFTVQGYGEEGDDDYFASYTAHYLEVPRYIEPGPTSRPWVSIPFISVDIPGTDSIIGAGRRNTAIILAADSDALPARECRDFGKGTDFDDWFLPSIHELQLMYNVRTHFGFMSSLTFFFWSSTQFNNTYAYYFYNTQQTMQIKNSGAPYHPIRAF